MFREVKARHSKAYVFFTVCKNIKSIFNSFTTYTDNFCGYNVDDIESAYSVLLLECILLLNSLRNGLILLFQLQPAKKE